MNIITSYDINEVYKNVKVKKPIKFNNKIILNIFDSSQNNLLFQSPLMYLPYNFIYFDNIIKYLDLCEYNDEKFLNFITILYKKIISKINSFNSGLFEDKQFYSNIVLNKRNSNIKMFRFKEIYVNKLNIYDNNNNLVNINQIVKESKIKCIFMIKNVWINQDKYGFNLELLQYKLKILQIVVIYLKIQAIFQQILYLHHRRHRHLHRHHLLHYPTLKNLKI